MEIIKLELEPDGIISNVEYDSDWFVKVVLNKSNAFLIHMPFGNIVPDLLKNGYKIYFDIVDPMPNIEINTDEIKILLSTPAFLIVKQNTEDKWIKFCT